MSCFWNALKRKITHFHHCKSPNEVLSYLQTHNRITDLVTVNNTHLTPQQLLENYNSVKDYLKNGHQTDKGHLTRFTDPFLMLCCENFKCNIVFTFVNTKIYFNYIGNDHCHKTYEFSSSTSHFQ